MTARLALLAAAVVLAGPVLAQQARQPDRQAQVPPAGMGGGAVDPMRPTIAPLTAFPDPDIALGRRVMAGGGADTSAAQACVTCHGAQGIGDPSGGFPRMSGQAAWYLYKQLKDYATGARPNDVMTPIARALSDEEMQAVAAYYAAQLGAPAYPPPQDLDPALLQVGAVLSAVGSPAQGIQACVNCHGPAGTGLPPSYPYLAGQYAQYQMLQLRLWREGVRDNDPLNVMREIALRMTEEQIRAVSLYFESVRPPYADLGELVGAADGG